MTSLAPAPTSLAPAPPAFDTASLIERFGSPLYIYDVDIIDRQVDALLGALPPGVDVAYAVKANPSLAVIGHLAGRGLGADVASGGELQAALRAGIVPNQIVMTGPAKQDAEMAAAARMGVRAITVESLGQLDRAARVAEDEDLRLPVLLRASTGGREATTIIGGDGRSRFGMDTADLRTAARRVRASTHLDLLGIHAFGASNVTDARQLVDHVAATGRIAAEIAADVGVQLRVVDAGGGLGIPYGPADRPLDLLALGAGIAAVIDDWRRDPWLAEARLLLEPGRFLVCPAGTYLASVVDVTSIDGEAFVVLDGGIHHVLRPALVGAQHRVEPTVQRPGRTASMSIVGPLCTGLDVLARDARMARPEIGDVLAVRDVGAYGFTESMPLFLSHPMPAEVVVRGGAVALARPRVDPGESLARQRIPSW